MPLVLVCRLCLRFTECSSSINNLNLSEGLADLLPNLDLTLTTNPVICIKCINLVTASYNFKKLCMENEQQIRDYHEKTNSTVDLHTIIVESQQSCNTIPKVPNNFKYPCDVIEIEEPFLEVQNFGSKASLNVIKVCEGLKTTQNMSNIKKIGHITRTSELEDNYAIEQFDQPYLDDKIDVEIVKSDIGSDAGLILSVDEELPFLYCNKLSSEHRYEPNSQNLVADVNSFNIANGIKNDYGEIVNSGTEPNAPSKNKTITETLQVTEQVNIDLSHKSLESDTYKKGSKATNNKGALYRKIDNRFSCMLCDKSFTQKLHVNGHLLTKHTTIPNIEERVESKIHYCEYCSYRTINNYNLEKHLAKIHNKKGHNKQKVRKFYCPNCEYSTETKQNITIHLRRHQTFPCCFCISSYSRQSTLEEHILLIHAKEVFSKPTFT